MDLSSRSRTSQIKLVGEGHEDGKGRGIVPKEILGHRQVGRRVGGPTGVGRSQCFRDQSRARVLIKMMSYL